MNLTVNFNYNTQSINMVNPYLYNQEYNVTLAYVSAQQDLSFAHLDQEYLHFEALLKLLHVASCTSLPS